jgi:hypothetical protein
MKYKNFRIIRFIIIIIFIITVIILLSRLVCSKKTKPADYSSQPTTSSSYKGVESTSKINYGDKVLPVSLIDKEIFEYQKSNTSTGEPDKDGETYIRLINTNNYLLQLRCDHKKGFTYWNRAKIDYNKNKKWDEKWSFSMNGNIKRQVSAKDDENYDLSYHLKGDHWIIK